MKNLQINHTGCSGGDPVILVTPSDKTIRATKATDSIVLA